MSKHLLLLLIVLPILNWAQITISPSTFPTAGDSLYYDVASNNNVQIYSTSSTAITWDFSGIQSSRQEVVFYYEVDQSSNATYFPDASSYTSIGGQETFYQISGDQFRQLGIGVSDLGAIQFGEIIRIEGNSVTRRANVTYGDKFDDSFQLSLSEATKNLPDSLRDPLKKLFVDSIKIKILVEQNTQYDAYGRMVLPYGQHDVLRAAISSTNTALLFAKVPILGWTQIDTSQFSNFDSLKELLKERKTKSYEFHTNDSKELAAKVEVKVDENKNETPTKVLIKSKNRNISSVPSVSPVQRTINVFPNPTFGDIEFNLTNYPSDNYKVEIYNIVGKKIETLAFKAGQTVLRSNLSHLRKGTYLYSIFNSRGEKLTTRRLVIMTP